MHGCRCSVKKKPTYELFWKFSNISTMVFTTLLRENFKYFQVKRMDHFSLVGRSFSLEKVLGLNVGFIILF